MLHSTVCCNVAQVRKGRLGTGCKQLQLSMELLRLIAISVEVTEES